MTIDFHRYKDEVKRAILSQVAALDADWDPFAAAWLAYALSYDGFEANQPLNELYQRLIRWAEDEKTWGVGRSLGALCFLGQFQATAEQVAREFKIRLVDKIAAFDQEVANKFSPLNDPHQVFPAALFIRSAADPSDEAAGVLKQAARGRMHGPAKRVILYAAALRELGEAISIGPRAEVPTDAGDVIALVWYAERYKGERKRWWNAFARIKDGLCFPFEECHEGTRVVSATEMALLYEALTHETVEPDPMMLFARYPLHPRVKQIAESLFEGGEYKNAVQEATQTLNDFIQERTGSRKSEAELVKSVMNLPRPILRMAQNLDTDTGKNEQTGLARIADGVFTAFRNPKAHSAKDAPHMQMDPQEALDQLAIISYMFKRVERARIKRKEGAS